MSASVRYQRLDPEFVAVTHRQLYERIIARFPTRNIGRVAAELGDVIDRTAIDAQTSQSRERTVRTICQVGIVLVAAAAIIAVILSIRDAVRVGDDTPAFAWLPILESGINDVVFASLAIWFLVTIPARMRRRRLLAVLHRLRSLAHVIDMHQLTKDPERLLSAPVATDKSVKTDLTPADLGRYLDYCSELLSLVGKAAALCAEESADSVVLDAVGEIEALTLGMSRKVWQKISLLHTPR